MSKRRLPVYVWVCEACGQWRDWGSDAVFNSQEVFLFCAECKGITKHCQYDDNGSKSRDLEHK